jgi:uncharacterized protein YceH (UPF0502 family)
MSEEDDLARRFFALWAEYLTALAGDPGMVEPLRRWLALVAAAAPPDALSRPPGDAAAAAGAFGNRDIAVAELASRVAELAERVAALERRLEKPAGERRRRTAGRARRVDREGRT